MSCYPVAQEITSLCADFLVELRIRTCDLRSAGGRVLHGAAASAFHGFMRFSDKKRRKSRSALIAKRQL
jgi:hypothetical protein